MKVKVLISVEEWYPIYDFTTEFPEDTQCIEVEEEIVKRWIKVLKDFDRMQQEIRELYN